MVLENDKLNFGERLTALAETRPSFGKVPPELVIATGHEDEVLLFLVRVGDADATIDTLRRIIRVSETNEILTTMSRTGGLINKRFPIDRARRLKQQLESNGAEVKFIRPDESLG